jgi:hypothetical protein
MLRLDGIIGFPFCPQMIMKIHYTGAAETEEIKKELISG